MVEQLTYKVHQGPANSLFNILLKKILNQHFHMLNLNIFSLFFSGADGWRVGRLATGEAAACG
jgi:hypothetical protein